MGINKSCYYYSSRLFLSGKLLDTVEIYNFKAATWRTGPSLPTPLSSFQSAVVEGKLLLFGGQIRLQVFSSAILEYDQEGSRWITRPEALSQGRSHFGLALTGPASGASCS